MPFTTSNTFTPDTIAVLGIQAHFRATGESAFIDLGIVENFAVGDEVENLDVESARDGLRTIAKRIAISATREFTFDSMNQVDPAILALHVGGDVTTDGAGGESAAIGFAGTQGEMLFLRKNAEPSLKSQILYVPAVTIQGAGETGEPGSEAAGLSFTAVVTAAEGYTVPSVINASEPPALYGYVYNFPTSALETALDAVADGGYTPGS